MYHVPPPPSHAAEGQAGQERVSTARGAGDAGAFDFPPLTARFTRVSAVASQLETSALHNPGLLDSVNVSVRPQLRSHPGDDDARGAVQKPAAYTTYCPLRIVGNIDVLASWDQRVRKRLSDS